MAKYETKNIRNIALVGHGDSGKTTLADAILFKTKANSRFGSIDDGSSVFDFDAEEKERRISIELAIASCDWEGTHINILDAPGYSDFIGEAISALAGCETAVICINASSGIMVNTRKIWVESAKFHIARAILINKMDMENINYESLLANIKETFGKECVPFYLPVGSGADFKGVVSVTADASAIPSELSNEANEARERLTELDDTLLEKYLEGGKIDPAELEKALPKAIQSGKIVPILCASSKKDIGVKEFLDFVTKFTPSPAGFVHKGKDPQKGEEVIRELNSPFSGFVFKSLSDPFVGKVSFLKVYSGTYGIDTPLFNQRTGTANRVGNLFKPFGKDQRNIREAIAGDIVGVTKVDELSICDTVCAQNAPIKYDEIKFPTPMVSLAAEPKSKADEQRLSASLGKMSDSDPTFKITRDRQTVELVITGMSQLHIDVVLAKLKRKYEVQLVTKLPKIPYKETINGKAEGHHKHKKQTGGHGQYGDVYLKIEPLERGGGFKFVDEITQGRIPNQYVPAVEKGIKEVMERGVIAGCPVIDVQVTLFDGSYHEVDSSEASFKIAASKAFQIAFKEARPSLLEPVVNIEIVVPSKFLGDITGDLNSRRGRIMGMDSQGNLQVIKAQIPLAEVMSYSTELRSITGGEGSYSMEFSHLDIVPQKTMEAIVARAKKVEEKEEE